MIKVEKIGPQEPDGDGQQERVKSPEELRFEALLEESSHMPLEPDYEFSGVDGRTALARSLRGAYEQSGDPEKMAMFRLRESKVKLHNLTIGFENLEDWDEQSKDRGYLQSVKAFVGGWKKEWRKMRDEGIEDFTSIAAELGLPMPKTFDEAMQTQRELINFDNWQKIAKGLEAKKKKNK